MKYSQDITSQAMIEVALALSMAFFSLLILVLVTMKLPELTDIVGDNLDVVINSNTENLEHSAKQKAIQQDKQQQPLYAFYHHNQFYDQQLLKLDIKTLAPNKTLILAVPENLTLHELLQLKQQINHPNASITNLSQDWITALEQLP
ncbi:MAG: hypothetical protein ACSHW0_02175 [Thalassotalea sp.]